MNQGIYRGHINWNFGKKRCIVVEKHNMAYDLQYYSYATWILCVFKNRFQRPWKTWIIIIFFEGALQTHFFLRKIFIYGQVALWIFSRIFYRRRIFYFFSKTKRVFGLRNFFVLELVTKCIFFMFLRLWFSQDICSRTCLSRTNLVFYFLIIVQRIIQSWIFSRNAYTDQKFPYEGFFKDLLSSLKCGFFKALFARIFRKDKTWIF